MNAIKTLHTFKEKFDPLLEDFLDQKVAEAEKIDPQTKILAEEIKRFAQSGGKRIRPAFMVYGYKAAGGKDEEAALYLSQALELVHAFALIHDDIIDHSDLRRGQPTIHCAFERIHQKEGLLGDAKHFGLSVAVLAGDLVFVYADEIFAKSSFSNRLLKRTYYDLLRLEVMYGQYLDTLSGFKQELSENEALKIYKLKTAKYTIERPLHIGACLAKAPKKVFEAFTGYGIPLGQAFQIQDDVLGLFGSEEKIGKPVTSDLTEGKHTLLIIKALERCNKSQEEIIRRAFGNPGATMQNLEKVREVVTDTGALKYAQDLASNLIEKAKDSLERVELENEGRSYLLGIADYMLSREY